LQQGDRLPEVIQLSKLFDRVLSDEHDVTRFKAIMVAKYKATPLPRDEEAPTKNSTLLVPDDCPNGGCALQGLLLQEYAPTVVTEEMQQVAELKRGLKAMMLKDNATNLDNSTEADNSTEIEANATQL
jgi:hypothetical protein